MWKYLVMIALVGCFFLVELIVGIYAESLSLQTDSFHMLSDLFALIIALISYQLARRKKSSDFTYGWSRAEIIGGLINSVFLLALCFTLIVETIQKVIELIGNQLRNPQLESNVDLVLIAGGIGLVVNLIGILLFFQEHHHFHSHRKKNKQSKEPTNDQPTNEQPEKIVVNYNNYALFLHILGDTLGSLAVIVSNLLIKYLPFNWKFIFDPIVSLVIVGVLIYSNVKLLRACVLILLHQTPNHLDYDQLIYQVSQVSGVEKIHDFHVWPLNNQVIIASLHVKISTENNTKSTDQIISEIKEVLHVHQIHASIIQPEFSTDCLEPTCPDQACGSLQCCGANGK